MPPIEIPTDWGRVVQSDDEIIVASEPAAHTRPSTPMQALMEAPPHHEPEVSQVELLELRDVLADAIDQLDDRARYVFEQHVIGGVAIRQLADWLGCSKSTIWKIKKRAIRLLRKSLSDHPAIQAYLTRFDQEDEID